MLSGVAFSVFVIARNLPFGPVYVCKPILV
jgi:hypothetical protein